MGPGADDSGSEPVIVGCIASPYGIKGWVRIHSFTDPPGNIVDYEPWLVRRDGDWQEARLEGCEERGGTLIARFAGCESRDDAARIGGSDIAVPAASLPVLEEGEYYWSQLTGLSVVDGSGQRFGRVERIMATGANDVLVVRGDEESIDRKERLIPFLAEQVVVDVDLVRGVITVDWDAEF